MMFDMLRYARSLILHPMYNQFGFLLIIIIKCYYSFKVSLPNLQKATFYMYLFPSFNRYKQYLPNQYNLCLRLFPYCLPSITSIAFLFFFLARKSLPLALPKAKFDKALQDTTRTISYIYGPGTQNCIQIQNISSDRFHQ